MTYPLAGWLGATAGFPVTFLVLAGIAAAGMLVALRLWPADDPVAIEHAHEDLPSAHPHLGGAIPADGDHVHVHDFVIDAWHTTWPGR